MVTQNLKILKICFEYYPLFHRFVMVSGLLSIVNVISCVRTHGGRLNTSFFFEKQLQIDPDLSSFARIILIFDRAVGALSLLAAPPQSRILEFPVPLVRDIFREIMGRTLFPKFR